jgi:hypothetical protein
MRSMSHPDTGWEPAANAGASPPANDGDWPVQATRTIVQVVDKVRDKTSGPAITAVAAIVYGVVAAVAAFILVVVVTAAAIRGLELLLWRKVWLAYLVLAALTLVGGLVCWSRRATVAN